MRNLIIFLIILVSGIVFSQEIKENTVLPYRTIITSPSATVFSTPSLISDELFYLFENDSITIIDTKLGWLKIVDINGNSGFITDSNLSLPAHVNQFRIEQGRNDYKKLNEEKKRKNEEKKRKEEERIQKEREKTHNLLVKKYGKKIGDRLFNGTIKLGDTKEMVQDVWGKPYDINKSVGSWGVHEQWIYGKLSKRTYFYFKNDKLTSWQN
jgi:hypothetical protein